MLTPEQIDQKQFNTTRIKEGYDQEEVDTFLDRVLVDYRRLQQELHEALDRNASLERRNKALSESPTSSIPTVMPSAPSASAERILVLAQETADRHVAEAKKEADEIVRQAGGKGARVVEEAEKAAEKKIAEASARAETIINEGYAGKAARLHELEARHEQVSNALTLLDKRAKGLRQALGEALVNFDKEIKDV